MTPERERLVRAVEDWTERCRFSESNDDMADNALDLHYARLELAAYDAAHKGEAK